MSENKANAHSMIEAALDFVDGLSTHFHTPTRKRQRGKERAPLSVVSSLSKDHLISKSRLTSNPSLQPKNQSPIHVYSDPHMSPTMAHTITIDANTLLARGVFFGSCTDVQEAINRGASPNSIIGRDSLFYSPVKKPKGSIGSEMNAKSPLENEADYLPAIHVAAQLGDVDVLTVLLNSGADIEIQTGPSRKEGFHFLDGATPLHRAAYYGNEYVCSVLMKRGANHLAKGDCGNTPIAYAIMRPHLAAFCALVPHYRDVNISNHAGESLLHLACQSGQSTIVVRLLQRGAKISFASSLTMQTPLHTAIAKGHLSCVEALLDFLGKSSTPEATSILSAIDRNRKTPVQCALASRDMAIIRAFSRRGYLDEANVERSEIESLGLLTNTRAKTSCS